MSIEQNKEKEEQTLEIPKVPQKYGGLLGNIPDVDGSFMVQSFWDLLDLYGPICELNLLGEQVVLLNNYELINDSADDDRFEKVVAGPLLHVRDQIGDGLFTAFNDEKVCSFEKIAALADQVSELVQGSPHPRSSFWANWGAENV